MTDLDLCYLPALAALDAFRSRRLSPVELLKAQIARAEQVEGEINAFTDRYFDEALAAAKLAEARYMREDGCLRQLEGLTVAVKDEVNIAGKRTTNGSLTLKDNIARETHPIVERLMKAGAIIHARTATPEFSSAYLTYSRLHGVTRNPWNRAITPSGSSGGTAASLAAGTATLATGSDIGGSIRAPAAMCGVVGFKPPYGRNPEMAPWNLDMFSHQGPLARHVGDCALLQNVMSGHHPRDIATLRQKVTLPTAFPPGKTGSGVKGWRIAYATHLGDGVVAPDMKANLLAIVALLRELGATVEEIDLGWGREISLAAQNYLDHLFGHWLVEIADQQGDQLCDYTLYYADRARRAGIEKFTDALRVMGKAYDSFGPMIERHHAFLCPTLATNAVRADQKPWEKMTVDGHEIDTDYDWAMTHPFNMLGRLPVLAVPSGIGANGVPTGIQIVARSYDDRRVFQLAAALEAARPWMDSPARRPGL
ncbi:amidase [Hypericibacter sp.]|uniref:amidase n=1 Tax=Hypericibacter sp. TaxID=2705401 RepID=UPI003D6CC53C